MSSGQLAPTSGGRQFSARQVVGIVLVAMLCTAALVFWAIRVTIYPSDFTPVVLRADEQQMLAAKLERLESGGIAGGPFGEQGREPLMPEPYAESDESRRINLSERELNSLLANNTDLARKVAIDLSENLASAKILIPLDPDFPILGGKTLRVNAGLELAYAQGNPIVVMRGISVMGVPIPNAWLGNLRNVDLVQQYGDEDGFWKIFADGVDEIRIEDGQLTVQLRE